MSSSVMMRQMRTIYHDDPHEEPCEEDAHNENANNDDDEDDGVEQNSETTNCTKKEEYMPISHELDMNEDSESHEIKAFQRHLLRNKIPTLNLF
jgi:hypothetical protein